MHARMHSPMHACMQAGGRGKSYSGRRSESFYSLRGGTILPDKRPPALFFFLVLYIAPTAWIIFIIFFLFKTFGIIVCGFVVVDVFSMSAVLGHVLLRVSSSQRTERFRQVHIFLFPISLYFCFGCCCEIQWCEGVFFVCFSGSGFSALLCRY